MKYKLYSACTLSYIHARISHIITIALSSSKKVQFTVTDNNLRASTGLLVTGGGGGGGGGGVRHTCMECGF